MAKSKKQRRQEIRDQHDARKFMTIVAISTVVLLILLYLVFRNSF